MPGFGNDFKTEALPGASQGMNSPQKCLVCMRTITEPFTAPRARNE